ncbi:hypothetical protein VaNZ11_014625 [Volvox africanus]|uniref:Protein kinase domain-containing protein n=1 Tax=Volvox africanus TaxID=51714 RepID=A0ABQ5SJ40_9CHLO|nr:hypothetical protein VaNZ11_014625 [Volvox africanus]
MVLLQFLGRLCASGADTAETYNKQTRLKPSPGGALQTIEHASVAHDLAVSTLHRLLSGLTGTSIQRIEGLVDALRTPEVTGATYVAFFAVAEGDHAEEEAPLVLLQSACYLGEESADHGSSHVPDQQQTSFFKRMLQEKAPIHAILDRLRDPLPNTANSTTTRPTELPPSGLAAVAAAPNPRKLRRMHVAAVPLLHGSKLTGALWLEKSTAGVRDGDSNGATAGPLLSDPRALRSLGFACSMCMLGPEASNAAWLAAMVARLGASDSMSVLTANLCAAVAAHVRRRFVLDAVVTAALVPPGPEVPLALLLQPSAPAATAVTNGNSFMAGHSNHTLIPNGSLPTGTGTEPARSGEERQLQLGPASLMGQSPQDPNGFMSTMAKRRLRPIGTVPNNSLLRDPVALIQARFSLDLSPRSPSFGPTMSSRSIIVPLHQAQPQTNLMESGPYPAAAGTPTLHAKAFPLHRTLLLAHLQQQQQQQHQGHQKQQQQPLTVNAGGLASAPAAATAMSSGLGESATPTATMQAISSPSATAVIEDTQLYVQNVHKPSRDVCMLMGLTRKTANGMLLSSGLGGGGHSGHSQPWASATGMLGGGPFSTAGAVASGAAAGGAVAVGGIPQSLVLLAMSLGEGGAALGLYLCFPKRLPAPLLDAVRASCQELLDKGLTPITRIRLKDAVISPEYETLCNANPGSYAVIRSASFCGLHAPPAFSGAYMSTVTGSDLVVAAGGGETAATVGTTPPELLSGELLTADMEVLLALQAQQAQIGGGQQGPTAQDIPSRRGSVGAIRRSAQDRALASSSFVRRSITAAGATASAARFAQNPSSPLSPPTTYGNLEKRTLTGSSYGPLVPAAGGNGGGTTGTAATAGGGECVEPLNLSQLLQSNPNDLLGVSYQAAALHTGSFRSFAGLENLGGVGNGIAASIITVSGVDNAATARQQLDLLVSSIHATINTDPAAGGASSSPMDDLDALELGDVLGQGGGGTVFKGKLGTLDVAVKLMELPKVDPPNDAAATAQSNGSAAAGGGPEGNPPGATDNLCLNARREMLRNATELAVQSRVSHPNIVQIYATYNDVVMVSKRGSPGCPGSTYRLYPATLNSPGPEDNRNNSKERRHVPCVAAAFELCDCGSLGSALAARSFPRTTYRERERDADGAIPLRHHLVIDMKGVYMTLLDVALGLRHLHSMHLVHRDIKPANLLLKSNPRDPRGFTVKLADFGFVLHLGETTKDGCRYAIADQACGTVTHMAPEALLAKAKIDASVDIYAFGILMWEMFSAGVRPYPRLQPDKIPRAVYRGARPSFSDDVPAPYRNLAFACWSTDPLRRPRASDVVVLLNGLLQELE